VSQQRAGRLTAPADLLSLLDDLGIPVGRPVLVVVGGAGGMTADDEGSVAEVLRHLLLTMQRCDGAIIDGGTDAGVMRALGLARHATGASLPLIGVAAEGTVILPGKPAPEDGAPLEPHHSHVILVPGDTWGDESPWISRVATLIAKDQPSLTMVINGGEITYADIDHSLEAGRPVVVIAGTGRTADAIAAAVGDDDQVSRAARIAASPRTLITSLHDPERLYATVESILDRQGLGKSRLPSP
jgi:hypothetical protein